MSNFITEWQRPKTEKLYAHPPKSERMYSLWCEGKILFGEIGKEITPYAQVISSSIWFTNGLCESLDFKNGKFILREDGIPVHVLKNKLNNLDFELETFGTFGRKSVCYFKLTLRNTTDKPVTDKIGFLIRTDKEGDLVPTAPDLYKTYSPDISHWNNLAITWTENQGVYRDGDRVISSKGDFAFEFDKEKGFALAEVSLSAGESKSVIFAYSKGDAPELDYAKAKEDTIKNWKAELAKITKLSEKIKSMPEKVKMINHLTVMLLQCFCYLNDSDLMLARQGGLQRRMWIYESIAVLEALSSIGDFDDYVEPIIDTYFGEYHTETGEIVPLGIGWAMLTGTALYSFSQYAKIRGKDYFMRYRDKVIKSFEWLKETRASTEESETVAKGLFPPKRSCDDPLVFQSWSNTDTFNLRGIGAFYEMLSQFNDPYAETVKAEYEDYLSTIKKLWRNIADKNDSDELAIPLSPVVPDELIEDNFHFGVFGAYLVEAIDLDEKDVERVLNYYTRRGVFRGGLYDRMPDRNTSGSTLYNLDENGKCIVWYVCCVEYYWFVYFLRHGMRDKAEEIIRDAEKYAMTDEYYMVERYNQRDPWFTPWCPNASANGRMICMLTEFYK